MVIQWKTRSWTFRLENIKTTALHEVTSLTMSLQSVTFRIAGLIVIEFVGTTMKKKRVL